MAENNGDTLPPASEQTPPAAGEGNTPPEKVPTLEELKNEVARVSAIASTAQKTAEDAKKDARTERINRIKAEKELQRLKGDGSGDGGNGSQPPSGGSSAEEEIEKANAEKGIFALLAGDQSYRELLEKDVTLKDILIKNPLSLISEYIDSEDAVDQVKSYLDNRLQAIKGNTPPAPPAGGTPPAGGEPPKPGNPPRGGDGSGLKYSADQIRNMSPDQWAKIPKEERQRMMQGEFN